MPVYCSKTEKHYDYRFVIHNVVIMLSLMVSGSGDSDYDDELAIELL